MASGRYYYEIWDILKRRDKHLEASKCEYFKYAYADSRQEVILELED